MFFSDFAHTTILHLHKHTNTCRHYMSETRCAAKSHHLCTSVQIHSQIPLGYFFFHIYNSNISTHNFLVYLAFSWLDCPLSNLCNFPFLFRKNLVTLSFPTHFSILVRYLHQVHTFLILQVLLPPFDLFACLQP